MVGEWLFLLRENLRLLDEPLDLSPIDSLMSKIERLEKRESWGSWEDIAYLLHAPFPEVFDGVSSIAPRNFTGDEEIRTYEGAYSVFARISLAEHILSYFYILDKAIEDDLVMGFKVNGRFISLSSFDLPGYVFFAVYHDLGKSPVVWEILGEDFPEREYRKVDHADVSARYLSYLSDMIGVKGSGWEKLVRAVRYHHSSIDESHRFEFTCKKLDQACRELELNKYKHLLISPSSASSYKRISQELKEEAVPERVIEKAISFMLSHAPEGFRFREGKKYYSFFVFGRILYVDAFFFISLVRKFLPTYPYTDDDIRGTVPIISSLKRLGRLSSKLHGSVPWWFSVRLRRGAKLRMLVIPVLLREGEEVKQSPNVVEVRYLSLSETTGNRNLLET